MNLLGHCPTCGQHHLAESDTEELHAMLAKCERLEREVLAENERLRQRLKGAVGEAAERIFASGILDEIAASDGGGGRDAMQDAVTIARLAFGGQ